MINLLPTQYKQDILYARRNLRLAHWSGILLSSFVLFALVTVSGLFYMSKATADYTQQANATQDQLKIQKLDETKVRLQSISDSFKLVLQVLNRQILFSKLLQQIGVAMPSGATLSSLSINKVQGGVDINAVAKDYDTATQVQINLQDPKNQIFEKADIVSISCVSGATGPAAEYPCTVTIRALFAKNNPFIVSSTTTKTGTTQ